MLRRSSIGLLLLLVLLLVIPAPTATAQSDPPSARDTAQARLLFAEGRRLAGEDRWAEAADRFDRALRIRESGTLHYNLGVALERLGRFVESSEHLRAATNDPRAGVDVVRAAREMNERVAPRIGRLTVNVDGAGPQDEILLDDQPLDDLRLGVALPVDPGEHRVEARRGSESVASESVTVGEGQSASVQLAIPAPEPEEPSAQEEVLPDDATDERPTSTPSAVDDTASPEPETSILPWVLGGAAVLFAGLATGASVRAISLRAQLDDDLETYELAPREARRRELDADADDIATWNLIADLSWLAAIAAGSTALIMLVTGSDEDEPPVALAPLPGGAAVAVTLREAAP